jgi:hypothetical protein
MLREHNASALTEIIKRSKLDTSMAVLFLNSMVFEILEEQTLNLMCEV